eukprot:TRINITY_DN11132_c0_g1_i5.p1 TRINITY_DN11132_c0_g1~~TRINITY_DN11132_c0_g1_i5.p1  ORF type:complete len:117 (-),score=21.59 TRINITY_DN11132_c0_g1_i5:291-641(-)
MMTTLLRMIIKSDMDFSRPIVYGFHCTLPKTTTAVTSQQQHHCQECQRPDGRYRKRDSDEPRTDLLGMDGCALYCVFWIIINGFIGTMLFFTIHARDRDFFKPVTQDPTGFFFGRQ